MGLWILYTNAFSGLDMGLTENMAPRFRHTSWFIIIFPVKMAIRGGGPVGQTWQVEIPCNQHLHFQGIFHCSPQESHGISWSKGRTGAMVPPPPDSSALSPGHPGMSSWLRTSFPAHGLWSNPIYSPYHQRQGWWNVLITSQVWCFLWSGFLWVCIILYYL